MYTDPSTNITFPTWSDNSGLTFGMIVPPEALTTDTYEYIGYLVRQLPLETIPPLDSSNVSTELYYTVWRRCSMVRSFPR